MHNNSFKIVDGSLFRFGIVRARFNEDITQGLLDGALKTLREAGVLEENIEVVEVPGSFEIPVVASVLAKRGGLDGVIALGCIIKGETMHDQYLATSVFNGLTQIAIETGVPMTAGVLTVNNREQALVRSGETEMNRGHEATATALEMAYLKVNQRYCMPS